MGLLTRLTNRSVDMAMRMQPRRTARVRDEILYAAPQERDNVQQFSDAGKRMVSAGLCPPMVGVVAVRRNDSTITRTAPGTDISKIDNRMLESIVANDADHTVFKALVKAKAVVWAYPPYLMSMSRPDSLFELGYVDLQDMIGEFVADPAELEAGICVILGRGVVAAGVDPVDAVSRLEAAELLAKIHRTKSEEK